MKRLSTFERILDITAGLGAFGIALQLVFGDPSIFTLAVAAFNCSVLGARWISEGIAG